MNRKEFLLSLFSSKFVKEELPDNQPIEGMRIGSSFVDIGGTVGLGTVCPSVSLSIKKN